jgi:hypothetical protein
MESRLVGSQLVTSVTCGFESHALRWIGKPMVGDGTPLETERGAIPWGFDPLPIRFIRYKESRTNWLT